MAGLFPPGTAQQTSSLTYPTAENGLPYGWQAVPIHTVPIEDDLLLVPWKGCRAFAKAMEDRKTEPAWTSTERQNQALLAALAEV